MGKRYFCDLCGGQIHDESASVAIDSDSIRVKNHPFIADDAEGIDLDVCLTCLDRIFKPTASITVLKSKVKNTKSSSHDDG